MIGIELADELVEDLKRVKLDIINIYLYSSRKCIYCVDYNNKPFASVIQLHKQEEVWDLASYLEDNYNFKFDDSSMFVLLNVLKRFEEADINEEEI